MSPFLHDPPRHSSQPRLRLFRRRDARRLVLTRAPSPMPSGTVRSSGPSTRSASAAAMVLIAPHDPLPLLDQARSRYPDGLTVEYLQSGPDAWHLRLAR